MFTWPIQDDQMNMTEIFEKTEKFTPTNINMVNVTEIYVAISLAAC